MEGVPKKEAKEAKEDLSVKQVLVSLKEARGESFGNEVALKLIESGYGSFVAKHLENFEGLNHNDIALKIIESGYGSFVAKHLENFEGLNHNDIALKLIESGYGYYLAEHLENFEGLNHNDIALKIIEVKRGWSVAKHLKNFEGLNHNDIALKIIEAGDGESVAKYLKSFEGLNHNDIALKLIEVKRGYSVARYLKNFEGLNHNDIALKIIEAGNSDSVAEYLKNFEGLNKEVALKLIEVGKGYSVAEHLENFEGLSVNIKEALEDSSLFEKLTPLEYVNIDNVQNVTKKELFENINLYRLSTWQKDSFWKEEADKDVFKQLSKEFNPEKIVVWWGINNTSDLHIIGSNVLKLYRASGVSAPEFMESVLNMQMRDSTISIQDFNVMIDSVNLDTAEIFARARSSDVEEVRSFAVRLQETNPLATLKSFKKYVEFSELLANESVLEKLQFLQTECREDPKKCKRYNFFKTLAFHKDSKVSMEKVFEFLHSPEKFLDAGDDHSENATENLKPINYTQFEHLDLSAEDLRDALTDGDLDAIQFFFPASREIEVFSDEFIDVDFIKHVVASIGSRSKGDANPKLFGAVGKILKKHGMSFNEFKEETSLQSELRVELEGLFGNYNFNDPRESRKYRVTVFEKSNPLGHVAGNDTASCMPFGSGKQNVYIYNTTCGQLVVQEKKNSGKWRTVAQSVLTPDIDIGQPVGDLKGVVESDGSQLHTVAKNNLATHRPIVITADNIEVSSNESARAKFIEKAYRVFMKEYSKLLQNTRPEYEIDTEKMIIGTGYSDAFTHMPTIENTFVPVAPPSYSDNLGEKSYLLQYEKTKEAILSDWYVPEDNMIAIPDELYSKNIYPITPEDTLAVAYLEGKTYSNRSLMQYISGLGNEIIGASINNKTKKRPNLMMKFTKENGDMLAYLLAYEGVLNKEENNPAIYISDFAADTAESKIAGGKLLLAFIDRLKKEYFEKDVLLPIVFEARESTSYKLIQKHLKKAGEKYGYVFTSEEINTYTVGEDTMHTMILRPEKVSK